MNHLLMPLLMELTDSETIVAICRSYLRRLAACTNPRNPQCYRWKSLQRAKILDSAREWTRIFAIRLNSFIRVYSRVFAVKIFGRGGPAPRHPWLKQHRRSYQFPGSMFLAG